VKEKKTKVVEFCKLLLHIDATMLEPSGLLEMLTETELTNRRNVARFRALCAVLDESQYPDAFHLWTAEVNGLDYFLTADRAFINVMTKTARLQLTTRPVGPRELLDDLGIPLD
jgi:predicted nucleic acid-binding protein